MARNIMIDCDTGMDDALALLLALRCPEFDVLGVTCVSGNISLDKVLVNTLKVVEYSGKSAPVFAGAATALLPAKSRGGPLVHGQNGLGDLDFPEPKLAPEKDGAVPFIIRTLLGASEPMEWITLGPLTNVALALREEPRIIPKIKTLHMMAGAVEFGNIKPMAEFNVFGDPEAARIVFESAAPKVVMPLDPLRHGGHVAREQIDAISARRDLPWCDMAGQLFRRLSEMAEKTPRTHTEIEDTLTPPDLLAVALAIDPRIGEKKEYPVFIETLGAYTRGMTVFDRRGHCDVMERQNANQATVYLTADQERYGDLLLKYFLDA